MKFTKDLISIIVPVFNREATIERCLNSLVGQTYEEIEIICINDGSTDRSLELLNKYSKEDSRIKVLSQINKGAAAARNVGLGNATGEYLMFCDSDDEYLPSMCAEMLDAIKTQNVDLVMCNAEVIISDLLPDSLSKHASVLQKYCNNIRQNKIVILDTLKRKSLNVLLWNKIFKREIIATNQIFSPEGCEHDDNLFVFLYSLFIDRYFALNKNLYHYYINNNSITALVKQSKPKDKYDSFKICCIAFDFLKESNNFDEYTIALKGFIDKMMLYNFKQEFFTHDELISLSIAFNKKFKELELVYIFNSNSFIVVDRKQLKMKMLIKNFICILLKTLFIPKKKNIKKLQQSISLLKGNKKLFKRK